jgi:hypothetical protein
MRTAIVTIIAAGALLGCKQRSAPVSRSLGTDDATVWDIPDAGDWDVLPLTLARQEVFTCDHGAAATGMDPIPFEDSSLDQLVPRDDGPCTTSTLHRHTNPDGSTTDTVVFPSSYYFGENGLATASGLVACASRIQLSPTTAIDGTEHRHVKDNISVLCAADSGAGWSAPVAIAGPAGNEWAAWMHSIAAGPGAGEYTVTWVRDYSLFPFTTVDDGRPPEDGVYQTVITASSSGVTAGATTKAADGVGSSLVGQYVMPDGTVVPYRTDHLTAPPTDDGDPSLDSP